MPDFLSLAARMFMDEKAPSRWTTPGALAAVLDPRNVQTPALDIIDAALVEAYNTPDSRLIISVPPQEGKSTRVGVMFPLWILAQDKSKAIVMTSYSDRLVRKNSKAVRNHIITDGHKMGLSLARDSRSATQWKLQKERGGMYAVSIGGSLTGEPADCISGDTLINCEYGIIPAAEAFRLDARQILAFDHETGRTVWRNVEAARRIPGRRVVEIRTQAGRVLTCTPDHRVYTSRGYVPAGSLRVGDALVALVGAHGMPVREPLDSAEGRRPEGDHQRVRPVLLATMCGQREVGPTSEALVPGVQRPDSEVTQTDVLGRVSSHNAGRDAGTQADTLPAVRGHVPAALAQDAVLLTGVREHGALGADGRDRELQVQGRDQLREVVQDDASADPGTGRPQVRGLQAGARDHVRPERETWNPLGSGDSSPERGRPEQPFGEPDYALPAVPHGAPQVQDDTVLMVRDVHGEGVEVYDFQVEGTRNFFGNGVLVHNCIIIDDPHKGAKEADSENQREDVWEWWLSTASARLGPGASVVMILTRWHEDDLAGRFMNAEDGHVWKYINIPAQADHNPDKGETDILGRAPGEFMVSARGRSQGQWEATKLRQTSRNWNALYQGRPSSAAGTVFKRDHWRFYDAPLWVEEDGKNLCTGDGDQLIQSWDMTFKNTKASDYVVGQVWLKRGPNAYLLDQVRRRMSFTESVKAVEAMAARWPQAETKLIEDKANGTAVLDVLRARMPGLIPITPKESKEARASAVTWAIEAGNVYLPAPTVAPWAEALVEEAAAFPTGAHDDQVDALTQALNRLMVNSGQGVAWLEFLRRKTEKPAEEPPETTP